MVSVGEIRAKSMLKISETMKEVVKNVLERIAKDNEKMDKNIESMV